MADKTLAVVLLDKEKTVMEEFPLPPIGNDDALLRVEACGLCGTDVSVFRGLLAQRYPLPFIPGHEVVGRIEKAGRGAAQRWNVKEGDLVAVEPLLHCGCCDACLTGETTVCTNNPTGKLFPYGLTRKSVPPAIWGGYSQFMYLHPNTILHKVPEGISPTLAALFNPLGSGVRWAVTLPQLRMGDTIVIMGPGQRGLCSVIAAREAGAGKIIVVNRRKNYRLDLAAELGAITIDLEYENLLERVREETGGKLADVVIDLTPKSTQSILDALDIVRPGGTVMLAGGKGDGTTTAIPTDKIYLKDLTLRGANGVNYAAFKQAFKIIASGKYPLERLMTHRFPLLETETAIRTLGGEVAGQDAICMTIEPWLKERIVAGA